ncbi:glycine--tRNA ligase subunit beta [Seohaeicola nanhaiensis]|uniref:Glycine--tRNA ligase beta subunit n=1 Tax=Seohaeicola nanhaiensis TaxID=1387282 RepID=A0ABV9KDV3_9RHOB
MPDLLIELFSEEIPARMQARAADDLKARVTEGLVQAGLTYAAAAAFATPRRLTLAVEGLLAASPALKEERRGPRADAPEKAIEGFLKSTGLTRDQLEERDTPKGAMLFAVIDKPGRAASEIIAEVLAETIRNFPWPKSMRWGSGTLRWVRPLHSILCILTTEAGAEVVPLDIDGIVSGDTTEGHRFMAPGRFSVSSFEDYAAKLKRAHVVLNPQERAEHIWNDAQQMAFAAGLEVVEDAGLLAEVAGLVEWPVVLMGQIGEEFLHLPAEVLQTSMREHQKFFSVKNPRTGRIERFITVANRETADNGATVLAGNRRVLSARLSDARFFWENDLRVARAGMKDWLQGLQNVTFHNKLGSQAERIERIAALARELAPMVGADPDKAETAARLAKADLRSEMVGEFPELQGVMGRYYIAATDGDPEVAAAAQEHYSPLGPSDTVPTAPVSVAVALADKIDTLTGFWAIDEKPTGSKDPFALRRAALGVIRLVSDKSIKLWEIFHSHLDMLPTPESRDYEETSDDLLAFLHDRLKVYLRDQGIRHDIIDACLAMPGNDDLTPLVKRAEALNAVLSTPEGENLLQGFKRANNILTQAEETDGVEYSFGADRKLAQVPQESALFDALAEAEKAIRPALEQQDFATAVAAMAALRAPIDAFFEAAKINDDSAVIRRNRLNLLSEIRKVCSAVADLTRVEG